MLLRVKLPGRSPATRSPNALYLHNLTLGFLLGWLLLEFKMFFWEFGELGERVKVADEEVSYLLFL